MVGGVATILFLIVLLAYGLGMILYDFVRGPTTNITIVPSVFSYGETMGIEEHSPHIKSKFVEGIGMIEVFRWNEGEYKQYKHIDPQYGRLSIVYNYEFMDEADEEGLDSEPARYN